MTVEQLQQRLAFRGTTWHVERVESLACTVLDIPNVYQLVVPDSKMTDDAYLETAIHNAHVIVGHTLFGVEDARRIAQEQQAALRAVR